MYVIPRDTPRPQKNPPLRVRHRKPARRRVGLLGESNPLGPAANRWVGHTSMVVYVVRALVFSLYLPHQGKGIGTKQSSLSFLALLRMRRESLTRH